MTDAAAIRRYYRDLGARTRAARLTANLTQDDLATALGMSRPSVSNIEAGRQRIPVHVLALAAETIGVAPVELLPDRAPGEHTDDFFNLDAPLADLPADARAFITASLTGPEADGEA